MLFNSYIFVLIFLPIVLLGCRWLNDGGESGRKRSILFLLLASLFFYGWFKPAYLALLLGSIFFNFFLGGRIRHKALGNKRWLALGVAANLCLLGYYKYMGFFSGIWSALADSNYSMTAIVLPLAISFFTFQQIAFLVERAKGELEQPAFLDYALFVVFFPQLIAGPIVRAGQILPQFKASGFGRVSGKLAYQALFLFSLGLFKKVFLADRLGELADPVFNSAAAGGLLEFHEAWLGLGAYTFQLYFDFSAYGDMAIGLGLMFGVRMPVNFFSPYKSASVTEFWRRWNMTLSAFLRDFLYIPLGGKRVTPPRQMTNLMLVMLLGGLWHGAGWTFVIWGGLHGLYLAINHLWNTAKRPRWGFTPSWAKRISVAFTFFAVCQAWVFFRASDLKTAGSVLKSLWGFNGIMLPTRTQGLAPYVPDFFKFGYMNSPLTGTVWISAAMILMVSGIAFFAPNGIEIAGYQKDESTFAHGDGPWTRRLVVFGRYALVCGILLALAILSIGKESEFIYFQF